MISKRWANTVFVGIIAWFAATSSVLAQPSERRIALVIGNANYQAAPLALPANDAGLIAQTLQAAGFDVVGARDLDADSLRHTFRDFLDKAAASGPDTVVFIYLSGYGVQYEGENYIVPVDARLTRDSDVPVEAVRLSDYVRPLNALALKARLVVLDAARDHPFARLGKPLAGGLALVDAEPGMLLAFNAAPGTVAAEGQGPYGAYAQALAEMIREGGLAPQELFDRVRQRVNATTSGAFVPWVSSRLDVPFVFFERAADAPPRAISGREQELRRARAIRQFEVDDAYHEALDRDTLDAYLEFLDAYPQHPLAKRVRVIVAARREALIWRRAYLRDTPPAYWSYLDRYPRGPHAWDARRRLRHLAAETEVPPAFVVLDFDVPPPPPEEFVFVERRIIIYSDPEYGFAAPPPPPIYYVSAPPADFVALLAPAPVVEAYVLPVPFFVPVPRWCDPPRYVAPPPNNVIFNNIHSTVINNVTNTTVNSSNSATPPASPTGQAPGAPSSVQSKPQAGAITAGAVVAGAAITAAALKVALPPAVARRQATIQPQSPASTPPSSNTTAPLVSPNGQKVPQLPPKLNSQPSTPLNATKGNTNGRNSNGPLTPGTPSVTQGTITPPATGGMPSNAPAQSPSQGTSAPSPGQVTPPVTSQTAQPPTPRSASQGRSAATPDPKSSIPPAAQPSLKAGNTVTPSPTPRAAAGDKAQRDLGAERQKQKDLQAAQETRQRSAEQQRAQQQAAQDARRRAQQQAAQDAQRRAQQQTAQEAQRRAQQQAAQEAQRRAQQQAAQDAQRRAQQAAQEGQRRAQQQAAQDAQRRAQQQAAQQAQQRAQQQAAQEAQRRAQAAQVAQQRAAQEAARQKAQQAAKKPCGQPGQPACPPR